LEGLFEKMNNKKVSIIIPALNEAESIGYVLNSIPLEKVREIIVIDGGSSDNTVFIAESFHAKVIHENRPGYGQACFTGLLKAKGKIVVFLDADGADDPRNIPLLIAPIEKGDADLVIGSRLAGRMDDGAMFPVQKLGNKISALLFRVFYHIEISDLGPFRAAENDMLRNLDLREMGFGFPTEMIALASKAHWRIKEIPVDYHIRYGGKSKISGTIRGTIFATIAILRTIFKHAW
jgi:glycosyltransferase involved in cell wall biosynthesis